MTKQEIYTFMNLNPTCFLATVEGNRPHVRGLLLYRADENGLIFHTGKMKELHKQLTTNPSVEICFTNHNFDNLVQVRVSGTAQLVEDINLKKEIVEKREFLKPWVKQAGYDPLAVYRVSNGVAVVWTFATNLAPKDPVNL
jgi:pyridoxamine 5'-phosphate oxidase